MSEAKESKRTSIIVAIIAGAATIVAALIAISPSMFGFGTKEAPPISTTIVVQDTVNTPVAADTLEAASSPNAKFKTEIHGNEVTVNNINQIDGDVTFNE